MKRVHGSQHYVPGLYTAKRPGEATEPEGRFGRMFDPWMLGGPHPALAGQLLALGAPKGVMDEGKTANAPGDSNIPSGYTFLGQFIDHDITLDVSSKLDRRAHPHHIQNARTPTLDLDCVYGGGPEASPHLYVTGAHGEIHIGKATKKRPFDDLARFDSTALIGDPRNDENLVVSQLQLAWIKFHNAVLDEVGDFEKARNTVVHYYHRIIVEDFLPRIIGKEMTDDILYKGRCYYFPEGFGQGEKQPYMPVEFSVAAYRFGHSMVRALYNFNTKVVQKPLFEFGSFKPAQTFVQWDRYFQIKGAKKGPEKARKIDRKLPGILFDLPFASDVKSLAQRNLLRGRSFRLPSGQGLAEQMAEDGLLDPKEICPPDDAVTALKMPCTPLWYYVLQEAETLAKGNHLGPVGGRIVGEVLCGLVEHYRDTTEGMGLDYRPDVDIGLADPFCATMADVLRFAGVHKLNPPEPWFVP